MSVEEMPRHATQVRFSFLLRPTTIISSSPLKRRKFAVGRLQEPVDRYTALRTTAKDDLHETLLHNGIFYRHSIHARHGHGTDNNAADSFLWLRQLPNRRLCHRCPGLGHNTHTSLPFECGRVWSLPTADSDLRAIDLSNGYGRW